MEFVYLSPENFFNNKNFEALYLSPEFPSQLVLVVQKTPLEDPRKISGCGYLPTLAIDAILKRLKVVKTEIDILYQASRGILSQDLLPLYATKQKTKNEDLVKPLIYSGTRHLTHKVIEVLDLARGTPGQNMVPGSSLACRFHTCTGELDKMDFIQGPRTSPKEESQSSQVHFLVWAKTSSPCGKSCTSLQKKLAQLPAVDMQKLQASLFCYSNHSPKWIQPIFDAQSLQLSKFPFLLGTGQSLSHMSDDWQSWRKEFI
ncbi:hypothetical protein VP01_541g4 [Puccinia sorghi]|uniref:Uncharacterized protein n=1 Tax=Puccinia sorghi TaxID=27349 RepID=A0A0L6UJQ6_9BASI|nr:hypothetical protein VP01_541g4 [Puccinia sorghi]